MTSAAAPSTPRSCGSAMARCGCWRPTAITSSAARTWTARLLDLTTERLAEALSPEEVDDLTDDQAWLAQLVLDVEAAKKDLSKVTSRDISVRTNRGRATVTITQSDLDDACSDLYYTTARSSSRCWAPGYRPGTHRRGHHGWRVESDPGPRATAHRDARKGPPAGRPRPRRRQGRGPARAPPSRIDADVRAHGAAGGKRATRRERPGPRTPVAWPVRRTRCRHPGDAARGRHPHRGQP